MEYQHWLREAISQLQASESPRRDAEILLEHVTGRGRTFILAFGETQLTDEQCQQLDALLTRRRDGEPIAHLTGVREFWSLPLFVSPATLIPRPDTECLVEQALARLPEQPCRILDLGTGTGAIALALARERPDCEITAVDRMPDAVALAQRNAQHLAIKNIHILQSDWFSALAGQQFAMIVSNPPYIDEQDLIFNKAMSALSRSLRWLRQTVEWQTSCISSNSRVTRWYPAAFCFWNMAGSRAKRCDRHLSSRGIMTSKPAVTMVITSA
ncbi:peptide chain release factor N(5)-glutamine methyltransferase [Escherichia coli]|nr:peptide chain release factor N(5)-glutamine methyltransferase [Escherichia coli]